MFDGSGSGTPNLYWGISDANNSVTNRFIDVDYNNQILEYYKQESLLNSSTRAFNTFEFLDLNMPINNNQYITLALNTTSASNIRVNAEIES